MGRLGDDFVLLEIPRDAEVFTAAFDSSSQVWRPASAAMTV